MLQFNVSFEDINNNFNLDFSETSCEFNLDFSEITQEFKLNFGEVFLKEVEIKPEEYKGQVNVIPMNYSQILETKDKFLTENIEISEVPFQKTINIKGNTITIGV